MAAVNKRHEPGHGFLTDVLVALLHQNLLTQQPGLIRKFLWSHECIRKTLKDYLQYMEIVLTVDCSRKTLYQSIENPVLYLPRVVFLGTTEATHRATVEGAAY